MTTRAILNKCRDKEVPRNTKQGVDEHFKLTCCHHGYSPSVNSPDHCSVMQIKVMVTELYQNWQDGG